MRIKPAKNNESIRILGVWINLKGKREFVIQQAKDEVQQTVNILKRKPGTDKQLLYLWNMVVIPRLEYRTQITTLTRNDCASISSPFRKLFKNKLNLSTTVPNAIINNRDIYSFRDFYEVLLQAKLNNFIIQLNDTDLLGQVTFIRLLQLQAAECLQQSVLIDWPYNNIQRRYLTTSIPALLSLCAQHNFTLEVNDKINVQVEGGHKNLQIRQILGTSFNQYRKQLAKHSILFLDQFTSLESKNLITWKDANRRNYISIRQPAWYRLLESIVIENPNSRLLKPEYRYPPIITRLY